MKKLYEKVVRCFLGTGLMRAAIVVAAVVILIRWKIDPVPGGLTGLWAIAIIFVGTVVEDLSEKMRKIDKNMNTAAELFEKAAALTRVEDWRVVSVVDNSDGLAITIASSGQPTLTKRLSSFRGWTRDYSIPIKEGDAIRLALSRYALSLIWDLAQKNEVARLDALLEFV